MSALRLLLAPARLLPPFLHCRLLAHLLRPNLRPLLEAGELNCLEGRRLRIALRDAQFAWDFSVRAGRLHVLPTDAEADATIAGDADAFLLLASRRVDPDTLFFQRRLSIEGDTELGLEIKNLLDTLDPEQLLPGVDWALQRGTDLLVRGVAGGTDSR